MMALLLTHKALHLDLERRPVWDSYDPALPRPFSCENVHREPDDGGRLPLRADLPRRW